MLVARLQFKSQGDIATTRQRKCAPPPPTSHTAVVGEVFEGGNSDPTPKRTGRGRGAAARSLARFSPTGALSVPPSSPRTSPDSGRATACLAPWRGGRVVECTALEMRHRCKPIGGSNPSLSASRSGPTAQTRKSARYASCRASRPTAFRAGHHDRLGALQFLERF